jgi:fibronectin-binding autotransporter adhesin
MRFARLHFAVLGVIVSLAAAFAPTAHAGTTYYWYGADTTLGGDGTWNTTLAYWSADTSSYSAVAWPNTTDYDAYFGGTSGGAVTISDNVTVGNLTLATDAYAFSAGTLGLGGGISASYLGSSTIGSCIALRASQTWNVSSGSLTVSGVVASSSDYQLVKSGEGALILSGVKTYAGTTIVDAGTLQITGSVSDTYDYIGYGVSSTGAATVSGVGSRWTASKFLYVGNSGGGTLSVAGGGSVSSGSSSYVGYSGSATGLVTVSGTGSAWTVGDTLNIGYAGSGTLNITAGGSVSSAYGNVAKGTGSRGVVTISGAGSRWDCGRLYIGNLGSGSLSVLDGGQLNVTNGSNSAPLVVGNGGVLTLNGGAISADRFGVITTGHFINQGGTFTMAGAGTVTTGTLSASGGLTSGGGNLIVGDQAGSNGCVAVNNGGTLSLTSGVLGVGNNGTPTGGSGTGNVTVANGTLYAHTILLGSSVGGSGSMSLQSQANLYVNGVLANGLTVAAGAMLLVVPQAAAAGGDADDDFEFVVSDSIAAGYLHDGDVVVSGGTLNTPNIKLGVTTGCTGTMTVTGGIVTAGNVYLGGSESETGGTGILTVSGGQPSAVNTLELWSASSSVTVCGSGTLTAGALMGFAGTIAVSDPSGGVALTVGSEADGWFAGAVTNGPTGPGSVLKVGGGTQTLSGNLTYTGTTTVAAGGLEVQDHALASSAISVNAGAALLYNTSNTITQGTTSISGGGTLSKSGSGRLTFGGAGGTITWALGAGATIDVQGGVLALGAVDHAENWSANRASLNIAAGAVCVTTAANVNVDALTGSGTLSGGYPDYGYLDATIGVNNGSGTFSGMIRDDIGPLNLVKTGSGTQTLAGANTYTGTTTVAAGALVFQGTASISAALTYTKTNVSAGALVFDYSGNTASGAGIAGQINAILTASYNGGTNSWASGTICSTLANTHSTDSYSLGWTNNTTTSAVTVKVVLYGDATLDGTVNIYDLGQVLANYNKSGVWATGDFNYDGTVNIYDLGNVLANYNKSLSLSGVNINPADYSGLDGEGIAALQGAGVHVVPEPGTLALLVAAAVGLLAYARRRRR